MDCRAGFAVMAIVIAAPVMVFHLLLLAASAERPELAASPSAEPPMGLQLAASPMTTALPPAGLHQQQPAMADDQDAAAMAGERLPPAASCWPHTAALPWAGTDDDMGGEEEELMGEREWSSCSMDHGATNSQEHEAMKASSLNGEPANTTDTVEDEKLPALMDPDLPWFQKHCMVPRLDLRKEPHEFTRMLEHFNVCLRTWTQRSSYGHMVLCDQPDDTTKMPCGFVIVPMIGEGDRECTLAFRADNLYLVAFANGENKWHVFKKYHHLIATATILDFDNAYGPLIGEKAEAKMNVFLGQKSFSQCNTVMSLFRKAPGMDEKYIKTALGTISIGIAEAKRLTDIRQAIVSGWLEGTHLNEVMAKQTVNWRDLSCAILVAENDGGVWGTGRDFRRVKAVANTLEEALNIVEVLIRPRKTENKNTKCSIAED